MNDLVVKEHVVIPIIYRPGVSAISKPLQNVRPSGWDSNFWDLAGWYKQA